MVMDVRSEILAKLPIEETLYPQVEGIVFTPTGVRFERELSLDDWGLLLLWGQALWSAMGRCLPWIIGDILVYGEVRFGEDYAAYIEVTNRAEATLRKYAWRCRNVPYELRDDAIPLSVYDLVARFTPERQAELLAWYRENNADREMMRALVGGSVQAEATTVQAESVEIIKESPLERARAVYLGCREALERRALDELGRLLEELGRVLGIC